jgi:hypothetical protein
MGPVSPIRRVAFGRACQSISNGQNRPRKKRPFVASPYARFNLFRNPFGELTREERAELAVVEVEPWLGLLRCRSTAIQFIGPCGHGKTTHLLAILKGMPESTYVYLPPDGPQPAIPCDRPLLIDEAQRLTFRQRRRVFRKGGPLVLGTHEDLANPLQSFGFDVLTVHVAADQSVDKLTSILTQRIEASRLSSAPVPRIPRQLVLNLYRQCGSNVRLIEQILYDQFQHAAEKGLPWPPAT